MVIKIPQTLQHLYHGCGWAIASHHNHQLIDFTYLRSFIAADIDEDNSIQKYITDSRIGDVMRGMQQNHPHALISLGMVSSWEFTEI